jgi:glycosyltransferase involved in cell wall biosynthesis
MIKISLIIPVYNVEQYLERCLTSCVSQDISLDEYEIIIINDGSKDNSLSIAERFEKEYKNITVYSQKNQGLSAARNKGLSLAKGEYVWFIDSDDWIEPNCLENLLSQLNDMDVAAMGYIKAYNNSSKNVIVDYSNKNIYSSRSLLMSHYYTQAQMYIYRREFLIDNSLKFYKGIMHEDNEFTPRMLYLATNLVIVDKPIYYFYKRPGSITTSINPKKAYDLIIVCNSLSKFSMSVLPEYISKFDYLISMNLNSSLYNSFKMENDEKIKFNNFIFDNRHLFLHLKRSKVRKYKIEGYLFDLFPKKTVYIYTLLQKFNKNISISE